MVHDLERPGAGPGTLQDSEERSAPAPDTEPRSPARNSMKSLLDSARRSAWASPSPCPLVPRSLLTSTEHRDMTTHENADFYDADGTFDEETRQAGLLRHVRALRLPDPRGPARATSSGRSTSASASSPRSAWPAIFWINNVEHDYLGHEIFLLPGQMIPEHWHVRTANARAKVEGWHLRHGSVTLVAEGEPTPGFEIPPLHARHRRGAHRAGAEAGRGRLPGEPAGEALDDRRARGRDRHRVRQRPRRRALRFSHPEHHSSRSVTDTPEAEP